MRLTVIAFTGQIDTHAPQPLQSSNTTSGLTNVVVVKLNAKASDSQDSAQLRQYTDPTFKQLLETMALFGHACVWVKSNKSSLQ